MPRYPQFLYPPPDFKCQYRDCCPYLEGLSTTWVFEGFEQAEKEYEEHLRITDSFKAALGEATDRIKILERENAELKAKLTALHQQQFKANKKTADQPGEDTLPEKVKKKRGAPAGHPGWVRPRPDHIDYTVNVPAPVVCPHCKSDKLIVMEEVMEHFQEDIAIAPRTIVTRYVHGQSFCKRCNRPVAQAGKGELMNSHIGPIAKAVAVYLRYRMGRNSLVVSVLPINLRRISLNYYTEKPAPLPCLR